MKQYLKIFPVVKFHLLSEYFSLTITVLLSIASKRIVMFTLKFSHPSMSHRREKRIVKKYKFKPSVMATSLKKT